MRVIPGLPAGVVIDPERPAKPCKRIGEDLAGWPRSLRKNNNSAERSRATYDCAQVPVVFYKFRHVDVLIGAGIALT